MKKIKWPINSIVYIALQWTWGILQTLLGFIVFLMHLNNKHYMYHGSVVTVWNNKSSMSLGIFVFITDRPFFAQKYAGQIKQDELSARLLVHEYGHTIQSLILGPLYLIIIGIPSTIWGFLFAKSRREKQIPYGAFFTEYWANILGEKLTGQKSIGNLVLD